MEKIFELCKERDIRCHFSYWKFDDSIHFIFTRTFAEQDCRLMQVVSIKDINNNSDIIGQYIVELIEDKLSDENCRKMILDRIEKLLEIYFYNKKNRHITSLLHTSLAVVVLRPMARRSFIISRHLSKMRGQLRHLDSNCRIQVHSFT